MPRRPVTGRASISGVALVLALLLSLLVAAPARAANGTLNGTVTGPDGNPQGSFRVEVFQAAGPDAWTLVLAQTVWESSTFLPPGEFTLSLPAGTYRACFRSPDEMWWEDVGRRCWSDSYEIWDATDIVVAEGGTTTITPALPAEGRVRGRIVTTGGAGVTAYVAPYRRTLNGTWEWQGGGGQSLADGTFVLPDLDPGTYRFCLLDMPREYIAECWDDAAGPADADELTVEPGSTTAIYFRIAPRASISGTLSRPNGSTHPIYVTPYRHHNGAWTLPPGFTSSAPVAEDGSYRIRGLDAGTYRVCADGYDVVRSCWRHGSEPAEARDIVLATSQRRTGIDFAAGAAGFVEGTLPDVYLGAEGWPSVTAYRRVAGGAWHAVGFGDATPTGIGNDWTYAIGSLPTGTYVACVHHESPELGIRQFPTTCTGNSPSPEGAEPFEVVAGQTTSGIDIQTGQASEIRGRVEGATNAVRVDLYLPSGRLATTRMTDAEGYYRIRELPAGSYRVAFHRETTASSLAAEWWQNKGDAAGVAGATPIVVPEGTIVPGIRAILDPGGTIAGRLLDASGDPVSGCQVQARARDGSLAVRRARTDASGDFAVGGLSTASYVVLVTRACSGGPTGIYYDADSPSATSALLRDADAVAVVRGATTTLAEELHTATP